MGGGAPCGRERADLVLILLLVAFLVWTAKGLENPDVPFSILCSFNALVLFPIFKNYVLLAYFLFRVKTFLFCVFVFVLFCFV